MGIYITKDAREVKNIEGAVIVLGSIPGWQPGSEDLHFVAPPGGILIDALPSPEPGNGSVWWAHSQKVSHKRGVSIVASALNADAITAAVWLRLDSQELIPVVCDRLRAIAISEKNLFSFELGEQKLIGARILRGIREEILSNLFSNSQSELFSHACAALISAARGISNWPGLD